MRFVQVMQAHSYQPHFAWEAKCMGRPTILLYYYTNYLYVTSINYYVEFMMLCMVYCNHLHVHGVSLQ